MSKGFTASLALVLALSETVASAQGARTPPPPPGIGPAQPAGDVCPAGGRNVTDAFAPTPAFANQTRAPRAQASTGYKSEVVASGLAHPRTLVPMPDGRFLIVDAKRRVRIVGTDGKLSEPITGVPEFETPGGAGIMDIALAADFAKSRTLYIGYYAPKPGTTVTPGTPPTLSSQIVRARLSAAGDAITDVAPIWQGGHVRRIIARADGTLVFTSAYGGNNPAGDDNTGQELDKDGGKVLRIRGDGSAPKDNPFASKAGALPSVYAYGLRDSDGLTQDAQGHIWTIEHGPRGGDELNQIAAGKNYGYPVISYGRTYGERPIDNGLTARDGMEQPVYFWTPDIAPSGLMVYSGSLFPAWKGDVFLGGLVAQSLVRLTLKNGKVATEEFMLAPRCKRVRDVRQGRDGAIYLITDADDGELLRLVPDKATKTASN